MTDDKLIRRVVRSRRFLAATVVIGIVPTAAVAQLEETAERRAACMADTILLCSSAIPNKARIASCLASKIGPTDAALPRTICQISTLALIARASAEKIIVI
jgi:hypothetical protein